MLQWTPCLSLDLWWPCASCLSHIFFFIFYVYSVMPFLIFWQQTVTRNLRQTIHFEIVHVMQIEFHTTNFVAFKHFLQMLCFFFLSNLKSSCYIENRLMFYRSSIYRGCCSGPKRKKKHTHTSKTDSYMFSYFNRLH